MLLAGALGVAAQAQRPIFRTGIEYVSVDVVVTDKTDKPIADLTKDDFEITERDRPQRITDFEYVNIPASTQPIDVTEASRPEPDVTTNVPPSPKSRLFALVIDDLHIIEAQIVTVKRMMTDFIRALSPGDEVAVVFVGRSDLSQNFTSNLGRVLKTIEHVREALGFGLDAMPITLQRDKKTEVLRNARSLAFTLKSVSASLAASGHARRAIVYVGGGSTLSLGVDMDSPEWQLMQTVAPEWMDAYETARRADVPIYTIDPRGGVMPEDAVRGGIGAIPNENVRRQIAGRIKFQQDFLSEAAINTGGRAFINSSNLKLALTDVVTENGSFYLLGYYPDPLVRDGKFHDITVKVRRPGTRVRARHGYLAPSADGAGASDTKALLKGAMTAGLNASGLSLRGAAAPMAVAAKGLTTVVAVEVDYPRPGGGSSPIDDDLQMDLLALDADAKVKASWTRMTHFNAPASGQPSFTFVMDEAIELPSQPLTLRVGVASRVLGRVGMLQLPVDVPKLSDAKLQMGGVAIGVTGTGPRETVMGGELIKDLIPFQPTTTRTFARTDTLRLFAPVFWGSSGTPAVTLTVTGGSAPAPQAAALTTAPAQGNRRQATMDATVSLKDVTPGRYVLEVSARLPNGQTAKRDVVFEIR